MWSTRPTAVCSCKRIDLPLIDVLALAASVARRAGSKADYIRTPAQDDDYYVKRVTDYLNKFEASSRRHNDELLTDKLSDALTDKQKRTKISNLLTKMKRGGLIRNEGSRAKSAWIRVV